MKLKHITLFTLVVAMMVVMVGAVSAHDENGRRGKPGFGPRGDSTIITDATGLTHEEIRDAIRDGSTLAELIEANGGDVDAVIADKIAEATEHINERVEDESITQERADEILGSLEERITDRVNGTFERPDGPHDGRRGRRGFGGDNAEDSDTSDDA